VNPGRSQESVAVTGGRSIDQEVAAASPLRISQSDTPTKTVAHVAPLFAENRCSLVRATL